MGHKVGVDPANHACVHISDLKEVVDLGVAGTAPAIDHLAHPPILDAVMKFKRETVVDICISDLRMATVPSLHIEAQV